MNELEKVIKDLRLEERSLLFSRVYLETEDYIGISGYETGNVKVEDIRKLQWYQDFVKEMEDTTINAQVTILQLGRGEPEWATEEELDYVIEYRKELEGVYGRKEVEENQYGLYHVQEMEWREEGSEPSYEKVQDKIYAELMNQERKEEMPDRLYKDIEGTDLTVGFWMENRNEEIGETDTIVTEELAEKWGISTEEIYQQAIGNTQKDYYPAVRTMQEMIFSTLLDDETVEPIESLEMEESQLYVLTVKGKTKGAIALLYPELLQQLSKKMNGNLFIIPSSIHEVLLLKDNGRYNEKELQMMVIRGNYEGLAKEGEVLGNNIYRYNKKEQCLEMATTKKQEKDMVELAEVLEHLERGVWIEEGEWER